MIAGAFSVAVAVMRKLLLCLSVLSIAALTGVGHAGPWPRGQGDHFLSLSSEIDRDDNSYHGLYGEYGLSARTTLGYEIGHSNAGERSLILWFQRSLDDGNGPYRFTWQTGAGVIDRAGTLSPVAIGGLALGRGFEGVLGGGWVTAEARVKIAGVTDLDASFQDLGATALAYLTPETTIKADLTLGFRPRPKTMWINQLRLEQRQDEDISGKVATSVVYEISGPLRVEAGVILPLSGPGEQAVKIGSWLEF